MHEFPLLGAVLKFLSLRKSWKKKSVGKGMAGTKQKCHVPYPAQLVGKYLLAHTLYIATDTRTHPRRKISRKVRNVSVYSNINIY